VDDRPVEPLLPGGEYHMAGLLLRWRPWQRRSYSANGIAPADELLTRQKCQPLTSLALHDIAKQFDIVLSREVGLDIRFTGSAPLRSATATDFAYMIIRATSKTSRQRAREPASSRNAS
jgi:hypothetical protein